MVVTILGQVNKYSNVYACNDIRIAETVEMFFCVHLPFSVSNSSGMLRVASINSQTCGTVHLHHSWCQAVYILY